MASNQMLGMLVLVVAILLPVRALAKEILVGDDSGWTINFDYQTWAAGKEFYVGDKLIFQYPIGVHNVLKVNGADFQTCTSPVEVMPLTTGMDVITLSAPGKKWYICDVGTHCEVGGQKLFITVLPELSASAPAPQALAPTNSANGIVSFRFQMLLAAVAVIALFI
ncbi:hypothetical protein GIB67_034288 [Kingdonia uniflora]|uniref:Phytocyanin domain-containing protein n=1 Tax=Kingdonia uniflora TaxID=39325 RepID=A0A7J7NRU2_9MAGN|nr:hypothetical protein GIB67_034288 [Kingdonia uniflora]